MIKIKSPQRVARTYSLKTIVNSRINDARLSNARMLVVMGSMNDEVQEFVNGNCLDGNNDRNILRYLVHQFDLSQENTPADLEFIQQRQWKIPQEGEVALLVLDDSGEMVNESILDISEPTAPEQVKKFLADNAPDQRDAKAEFEAALVEAKRTDRKVWARICQTRCGPCFLLSRWIDKHRDVLEKEFVMYRVDNVNDKNGVELYRMIMPEAGINGVPFHAVMNAEGEILIDSRNLLGNIGFPGESYLGQKHLKKMLSTDLKHLSQEEVDQLVDTLIK